MVFRDGIEPPTRGFSKPVKALAHSKNDWTSWPNLKYLAIFSARNRPDGVKTFRKFRRSTGEKWADCFCFSRRTARTAIHLGEEALTAYLLALAGIFEIGKTHLASDQVVRCISSYLGTCSDIP